MANGLGGTYVYQQRGGDTTAQMESWTTVMLSAWKHAHFSEGQKIQNRPKMGVRTHFFATPLTRLDLEQACMARSACRRVAAL